MTVRVVSRVGSRLPAYCQPTTSRYGLNGRKFTCYKFRSMHAGSDEKRKELIQFNLTNGPGL